VLIVENGLKLILRTIRLAGATNATRCTEKNIRQKRKKSAGINCVDRAIYLKIKPIIKVIYKK
jgi:hypothetical protein